MPDIKTALSAALLRAPAPVYVNPVVQQTINEWDDEDFKVGESFPINNSVQTKPVPTPAQPTKSKSGAKITSNVMRATFEFIQQYPGLTAKQICEGLERKGLKPTSVVSVISQLYRSGQVHKDGVTYRTVVSEYMPVSMTPVAKLNKLKKQVNALKEVAKSRGIKDLPIAPARPVAAPAEGIAALDAPAKSKFILRQTNFDAKEHIDKLSVYQAREVYAELKTMFGG